MRNSRTSVSQLRAIWYSAREQYIKKVTNNIARLGLSQEWIEFNRDSKNVYFETILKKFCKQYNVNRNELYR